MRICILGNSPLFIGLFEKVFPGAELVVLSWRAGTWPTQTFDWVFICGFDQAIYSKEFRDCVWTGYLSQYLFVRRLQALNGRLRIGYVNSTPASRMIVSRYDFAKHRMAVRLSRHPNFGQIRPKFVVDEHGEPLNPKGRLHSLGFKVFRLLDDVDTCTVADLERDIRRLAVTSPSEQGAPLIPQAHYRGISFRRGFLTDKLLKALVILFRL